MQLYKIVRYYEKKGWQRPTTVRKGLTLEDAQKHCSNPETSSSTAQSAESARVTRRHGGWFDGYTEDN